MNKTILWIIAGLLVVAVLCVKVNYPPDVIPQPEVIEWVNGGGDIVASIKADPEYFAKHDKHLLDSMAKVYETKIRKIKEAIIVTTEGDGFVPKDGPSESDYFPQEDNCPPVPKNMRQEFSSPYYHAFVQVGDSSFMRLQSFDTVTVLWKRVKEGNIFNRHTLLQLDVSTANPDTKVSGIKAYRIYEKPKRWGVGFQLGYGFQKDMKPAPFIGVGLSYNVIKF